MAAMTKRMLSQSVSFIAESRSTASDLILRCRPARISSPSSLHGIPDQTHQSFIGEGFSQKAGRSVFKSPFFNALLLVGRDKNNRQIHSRAPHLLLNLKAGHPGHLHVDHRTIRIMRTSQNRQEFLAGRKRPDLHPPGGEQTFQRPAHGRVIVDDMDEWGDVRQAVVPYSTFFHVLSGSNHFIALAVVAVFLPKFFS